MADLVAELKGYRDELAGAKRPEQAKAIQAEIDRIETELRARVEAITGTPAYDTNELERITTVLDASPAEDATEATPRERAVPAKKGAK